MPAPDEVRVTEARTAWDNESAISFARMRRAIEDESLPVDYRKTELREAAEHLELSADIVLRSAAEVRAERLERAERLYAADPEDPNRAATLLEADMLARGHGSISARNVLIPEGQTWLAKGNWKRAEIFALAARVAGAPAPGLVAAIERAKDAALPNRLEAIALRQKTHSDYAALASVVSTGRSRGRFLSGHGKEAAAASIESKLRAFQTGEGSTPGLAGLRADER